MLCISICLYCVAIESTFLSATDDLFRFYRQLGMVALLTAFGNLVCFMFDRNNTYVPDITVGYQTIFHFFGCCPTKTQFVQTKCPDKIVTTTMILLVSARVDQLSGQTSQCLSNFGLVLTLCLDILMILFSALCIQTVLSINQR